MKKRYPIIGIIAIITGIFLPINAKSNIVDECENQLCFYGVRNCIDAKPSAKLKCDGPDNNCTGESSCK